MILNSAGILTDWPGYQSGWDKTSAWKSLVDKGFKWAAFQAVNDPYAYAYDLNVAKSAGMSAGVWTVVYNQDNFYEHGWSAGKAAIVHNADFLIIDAEFCLKKTRDSKLASQIIKGIRDASCTLPVSVTTLGSPVDPNVDDFEMDVQSFLDTGGFVLPQAYPADGKEYIPTNCLAYWRRMGVADSHINVLTGLHNSTYGRMDGFANVQLLKDAGWESPAISIFQAQDGSASDWDAFAAYLAALQVTPTPSQPSGDELVAIAKQSMTKAMQTPAYQKAGDATRAFWADKILSTKDVEWRDKLRPYLRSYTP